MQHISEAIAAVIADTKEPLKSDGSNEHFKYGYTTIDGVLQHLRPAMAEHGVILGMAEESFDILERQGKPDLVVIRFAFWLEWKDQSTVHEPRTQLGVLRDAQSIGTISSYAQKYWLRAKFMLSTGEKDADASADSMDRPHNRPGPKNQNPFTGLENDFKTMGFHTDSMNVISWIVDRDLSVTGCAPLTEQELKILNRFRTVTRGFRGDFPNAVRESISRKETPVIFVQKHGLSDKVSPAQPPPPSEEPSAPAAPSFDEDAALANISGWLEHYGFDSKVLDWICVMRGAGLTPETLSSAQIKKVDEFFRKVNDHITEDPEFNEEIIGEISGAMENGLTPSNWLTEITN